MVERYDETRVTGVIWRCLRSQAVHQMCLSIGHPAIAGRRNAPCPLFPGRLA